MWVKCIDYPVAARYIAIFASATPVSTIVSALLINIGSSVVPPTLLGYAFAFSAGTFLHVALTHILPSIGHHVGITQVGIMMIGVLIPYFLFMEHEH